MSIDNVIHAIYDRIYAKLGDTREAEMAIDPLKWYVATGRAPLEFETRLTGCSKRQLATIANRLIRQSRGRYDTIINGISAYLGLSTLAIQRRNAP